MKKLQIHNSIKAIFSVFMLVSAFGELSQNETVIESMQLIQMPEYLLILLGWAKVLGVLAIWFSPYQWLKEWAYAGFVFDFLGAIFAFIYLGQYVLPDIIMAPMALILCVISYLSMANKGEDEMISKVIGN